MTCIATSTSKAALLLIGCGLGLNVALLLTGRFGFCGSCSGLNAVLAFPWPVAGLVYWVGAAFVTRPGLYAVAGLCAQAALVALGLTIAQHVCITCLIHFGLLAAFTVVQWFTRQPATVG